MIKPLVHADNIAYMILLRTVPVFIVMDFNKDLKTYKYEKKSFKSYDESIHETFY